MFKQGKLLSADLYSRGGGAGGVPRPLGGGAGKAAIAGCGATSLCIRRSGELSEIME